MAIDHYQGLNTVSNSRIGYGNIFCKSTYEATDLAASAARWNSTAWRRRRFEFRMNRARAGLLPVIFARFSYLAASVNLIWTLLSSASTLVAISHFLMQKRFTGLKQKSKGDKYKERPKDASDPTYYERELVNGEGKEPSRSSFLGCFPSENRFGRYPRLTQPRKTMVRASKPKRT